MMLKVVDLAVARGGVPLLAGLSFDVKAGDALVIRGPNGAGKTTLLRTLAGLQPPLSGEITLDEDSVAYAAHADGLKAMLSLEENLRFWAQIFGTQDIASAIAAYDLEGLRNRLAGTLSAGQKRRLGLARLLVTGRPLWIMDEPTVSLDAKAVTQFAAAVEAHRQRGGAAIIATHIELGLEGAAALDVTPYKAQVTQSAASDEAFL